jgi:hypothetical protein
LKAKKEESGSLALLNAELHMPNRIYRVFQQTCPDFSALLNLLYDTHEIGGKCINVQFHWHIGFCRISLLFSIKLHFLLVLFQPFTSLRHFLAALKSPFSSTTTGNRINLAYIYPTIILNVFFWQCGKYWYLVKIIYH